jgi:NADH-quinone oxidoreductase subunit A
MPYFSDYALFGGLLCAGLILGTLPVVLPLFIAPRTRGDKTREIYECGVDTIGSAWIRFDIAYYLFALIFVAFEVDVLYILPVALVFDRGAYMWRDLVELSIFISILMLAIIYAWRKGVLHWR